MKRLHFLAAIVLILFVTVAMTQAPDAVEDGIRVYFSPDGGADQAIIVEIQKAKATLDVAAYSYTHPKIAKATADAHRRGVKVRVILDKSQSTGKYSSATYLDNAGVPRPYLPQWRIAAQQVSTD